MRSAQRTVLRVLALLGLLAVLIGVPVMVARTIGLPQTLAKCMQYADGESK